MNRSSITLAIVLLSAGAAFADEPKTPVSIDALSANEWALIYSEDASGGKRFSRAIWAENVGQLYLWGTGGRKPARNVYERYELESFDPRQPKWQPAFPTTADGKWSAKSFPPFRIYGQSGPDGLNYDEGPRLQVVGGYHSTNRVRWWDFDGIVRPSPVSTFNMACWDSKRSRIIYFSDGFTLALDPKTNSWTDLKPANHPTTCRTVAWASMCYDRGNDRVMLFGGGLATNPSGAAPTWFYDCAANVWKRPKLDIEPPPRCNGPIVYDPATRKMVLFGGYDQAAALNDTWVYDCEANRWEQRKSQSAPPPMEAPAVTVLPNGRVLICGNDARIVRRDHLYATSAIKQTWVFDIKQNKWTPIHGDLKLQGYSWLTAAYSEKHDVALMVAFGPERRTYALRFDPSAPAIELQGAPSNTIAWKYPEQKESLEQAPPPLPEAHGKLLSSLPVNRFVNAEPPGFLISKTWSTAVIDTDRSEVLYVGGGHSGYSGNDIARYSIASNRWSLDFPPRFPPFLEGTNAGIFGWSYGMMPFSQHTYLWYCYDPVSKTVVYLARSSLFDGIEVQLGDDPDDVFKWEAKKQGCASWVYDPAKKTMHKPSFGRPFKNQWRLTLVGTPRGVYAVVNEKLYHAKVDRTSGGVEWTLIDAAYPKPAKEIKYHYEFQPLIHDTRRDRLIQLKGDASRVDVFARSFDEKAKWQQLATNGNAAIGREAVYIPQHDTILWLGSKLYALDLSSNTMSELDVELPKGSYTHECAMVYDPKHDVCVALIPRSFSGPMQTFLFRYDPISMRKTGGK